MATETNIQESVCLKKSEREESALTSESFEEKATELPGNKAKQLETSSRVAETVNTPLETGKPTEESGIFFQALSDPMVIADEHSNTPESCKAAKQTEPEEETVENDEKAIESEVYEDASSELFDSVAPSKKDALSMLEKNQGDSDGVTSSQVATCEDIEETTTEQHVTTMADFKEQDLDETRREFVKEETVDKSVDAQEASEQCEIGSRDIEERTSEESVKKIEQDEEIEEIKVDLETEKQEQNGLLQPITSDACISTQTKSQVETTEHEQKDKDVNVLEEDQDNEHEVVEAKGSIQEDTDVCVSTQTKVVKESIKNEEPDDEKAIEKEACEENVPNKAEFGGGLEIYDSVAPSQKETLNMLEKDQDDSDGVTSAQESPCVDVEGTTTIQHEKVREFIEEETKDKSLDPQEASKECEKGAKEEIEQEAEESVKNEDQAKEQDIYVSEEGRSGGDDVTSTESASNKDITETTIRQHETTAADFETGQDLSATQREILIEEAEEKSVDAQENDDGANDDIEQKLEESVDETAHSYLRNEQEEYTEEIKPSVKTIGEDVCISTQIQSQEEATKNEENDIESDGDQREKSDNPFVDEVFEENDLKKTESEKEIHLSDSPNIKTRESVDADTEETKSSDETKENEKQQGLLHAITTDVCSSTLNENEALSKEEKLEKEEEIKTSEVLGGGNDVTSSQNVSNEDSQETTIGQRDTVVTYVEEGQGVSAIPKEILIEEAEDKFVDAQEMSFELEQPNEQNVEIKKQDKDLSHESVDDTNDDTTKEEKCTQEQEPVEEQSDRGDVSKETVIDSNETTEVEPQEDITPANPFETSTEDPSNSEMEKAESENLPIEDLETVSEVQIPELVPKLEESVLKEECSISETETHLDEEKETVTKEISSDEKIEVQSGEDDVTNSHNASSEDIQETTIDQQHDTTVAYVEEGQGVSATPKEILKEEANDRSIDAEEMSLEFGQPNEQNVEETHPCLSETISENPENEMKKEDRYLSPESAEDTNDDTTKEEKFTLEQEPVEEQSDRGDVSKETVIDSNETTEVEPQVDITRSTLVETSTEDTSNSEKEKAEIENLPIEDLETVCKVQIPELVPKSEESVLKEECFIPETETHLDEEKGVVTEEISSDEKIEQITEIKQETVKEVCEETSSEKAEFEEGLELYDSSDMKINEKGMTTFKNDDQEKDHEVNMSAESQGEDSITSSQNEASEEKKDVIEEIKSSVETKENTEDVIATNVCSSTQIQPDEETIENDEKAIEYDENETVSIRENIEKKQDDVEERKMGERATTVAYHEEGKSLGTATKEVLGDEEGDKSVVAQEETEQYDDGANDEREQKPEEHTDESKTSVETNEEKDLCISTKIESQEEATKNEEHAIESDEETIENDDGQTEKPESPLVEVVCEATSSEMAESEEGIKHSDSFGTLDENETLVKENKMEKEDEIKTSKVQGGGDDITRLLSASNEDIEETTIGQHDTSVAYVEKGQGVGAIANEVVDAKDKSIDAEEMSLELAQPNEQNVEDSHPCPSETISENPEDEIKKEDKDLSPESAEDANDDTTKEEKREFEQEPVKEHSGRDEVSKEEDTNLNETTELEPKENITPSNPLETSTEDTSNEKAESENSPIEDLETVREVQIPELVPKSDESVLKEECFVSETETHLDEEKGTVTKEISSAEQKDQTSEIKQETVKEICEETSSEKAEFEEGLELSDSSNMKINDKGITTSKDDNQEKDHEVNMPAEREGEENVTSSQNEVSEEKEDLQEKNYHSEGNEGDFIKSGEGVDKDTEEIKSSVETKENTEDVIATNVCSSTQIQPDEETIENEEKIGEKAIEYDENETASIEDIFKEKQEDVCSSAQTEPKEETIYNEEKNEEAISSQNASSEDTKETASVQHATTMVHFEEGLDVNSITKEIIAEEADDKSVHAQEVSNELGQTKEQNVEEIQACLTETMSEKTEDMNTKKDEDLSHDSIEHINDNIINEQSFSDGITKEIETSKLEHEPLEEQNDSLDEVSKEKLSDLNEATAVEPQEDVTPSSSLRTLTEDTLNSDKAKAESQNLPIEDLESVSQVHIPEVEPRSEDSKMKEGCLISATATYADEENRIVTKEISSDENLETHGSTQQPENSYRTTEENATQLEQIGEINSMYENRDMKEDVRQESQLNSTENCSEMVKDVILTEEIEQVPLEEKSTPDQKEMVHEISYSESIPVGDPEVTDVNVDAQIGQEDLQGEEHISCVSKVTNEADQEPKEERIPFVEDSTTVESPVDVSNIESTAYPSKVTNEVDQEPQALESDCDVQIPEIVADSEDSKVKEECIVLAAAEHTDENNEISSATVTEQEHVMKAPIESDEANSNDVIIEEKALTKENLEIHGELKPTSEPVIEEYQVTTETKPPPEQSDITSENITSDQTLEPKLEQTSGKDLEDGKDDVDEDVTHAPENEIKSIENQDETTKNIILTDKLALETEKENERNELGQVSEDNICPTKLDITSTPNQKELANNVLLEDEKAKESQSIKDIINEEAKLNQLTSDTDDSAKTTYDSVLSSTEQDIEIRSEESKGHGDMVKLEEKPTEISEIATEVAVIVPECGEASATDVKIRDQGELVHCGSQEPYEDNTSLSQNDKNTEDPEVLPSVEKDVTESVDKRFGEALVTDVQKHEKDLDHETEVRIADVVSDVQCPEVEPPHLDTKEATSEFIKQENQREQKKEADESIEVVIPVEDVKTSTRKPEVRSVDLEVPSVMDATADKANNKTIEVHEASKELLKDDEHLESTFDQSKPVEEGSGMKQEPLEVDAPEILGTAATKDLKISQKYVTDDLIKVSQTHPEIQKYEAPAYTIDKQQSPNEPHQKESTESKILTEKIGSSHEQGEPIAASLIPEAANLKVDKVSGTETQCNNTVFIDQKEKSESVERDSALTKDQQVEREEIGESGVKTDEDEEEDNEDDEKMGSGSDAPVMVEASRDMDVKVHKKSHNILSGVGSKVKHSIAKVKKAITGKSSPPKSPAKNQVIG